MPPDPDDLQLFSANIKRLIPSWVSIFKWKIEYSPNLHSGVKLGSVDIENLTGFLNLSIFVAVSWINVGYFEI